MKAMEEKTLSDHKISIMSGKFENTGELSNKKQTKSPHS
ncbi:hypothetical protein C2W58_03357 [Bacillus pumilus]|uniref:Uncharacterized protein n=1 Tax=Bacillus pumilus TaxID=1408 RepID=A0AB34QU86_BACPU|nr:hypothetical protein B4127_0422 [Bacillus pumilus]RAP12450.1 hypothetical protein C2W58_03357 [Bacillus pumilus]